MNHIRTFSKALLSPFEALVQIDIKLLVANLVNEGVGLLSPNQAAGPVLLAFALGTLLSFIPAPLIDSVLVGVILARFRHVNRAALIAARIVWNDLVVIPLYLPAYRFSLSILEDLDQLTATIYLKPMAFILGVSCLALGAVFLGSTLLAALFMVVRLWQTGNHSNFLSGSDDAALHELGSHPHP